jgi:Winged helix DNA-binding domain
MTRAATVQDLARLRLRNQRLVHAPAEEPADAVRWMLAMQAQDFAGALWSVGVRAPGTRVADVTGALDDGRIVRSWPMRGTLHLTAPEDLPWMLELIGPRMLATIAPRRRQLGISDDTIAAAADLVRAELDGGRTATRAELFVILERAGEPTAAQRGINLLGALCQSRVLCLGPRRGAQHTFVLFDEWLPAAPPREREESLRELALRYFRSHGPATARDLAWWTQLLVSDVRTAIESARDGLEEIEVDGVVYLQSVDAPAARGEEDAAPVMLALPGFDELLLGYRDRAASLEPEWAERVVPGKNGLFLSTIVDDGRVLGTWRRTKRRQETLVETTEFGELDDGTRARFRRAVDDYGRFLGSPVRVA